MMDFWLTMGVLLSDERLSDEIKLLEPAVKPVELGYVWGDDPDHATRTWNGTDATTKMNKLGDFVEWLEDPTNRMQAGLDRFFRRYYPDLQNVISVYCASRICRLCSFPQQGTAVPFLDAVAYQRARFLKLEETYMPGKSKAFLALLGMSAYEEAVRELLVGGVAKAGYLELLDAVYFGPQDGPREATLREFARPLLGSALPPSQDPGRNRSWDPFCGEVMRFYAAFARGIR